MHLIPMDFPTTRSSSSGVTMAISLVNMENGERYSDMLLQVRVSMHKQSARDKSNSLVIDSHFNIHALKADTFIPILSSFSSVL